jgi:hypothetical protein
MLTLFQWISAAAAFVSAGCWLYGSRVKVTRKKALESRLKEAERLGHEPSLAGASLDGWDMSATFAAQSKWNARGALAAGIAVTAQAVAPLV